MKIAYIFFLIFFKPLSDQIPWGITGHRTVGEVASQNISEKTSNSIKNLLEGESLSYISNYADDIKSDKRYQVYNPWHYANMKVNETYYSSEKNVEGDVIQAIKKCIEALKSKKTPKDDRRFYLKLLVHFVGDIHQPMHLGEKKDKGGNNIKLKWFGENTNLHRIWDSDIIDSSKMSYTELTNNLPRLSNSKKKEYESSPIEVWVKETHDLTKKIYKDLPENINLGYRYRYENFDTIRLQLLKAGLRLAYILDDIFK